MKGIETLKFDLLNFRVDQEYLDAMAQMEMMVQK